MKTLEERLADRLETYNDLVKAEIQVEVYVKAIAEVIDLKHISCNIYVSSGNFYIYPKVFDDIEEKIIPHLSSKYALKWERSVREQAVCYTAFAIVDNVNPPFHVYFTITAPVEGTCRIIAVPTGKTRLETKYVEIEVPEMEYLVDCGDTE